MKRFILLSFLLSFACSPVYKIKTIYIPPVSEEGIKCAEKCEEDLHRCNEKCHKEYERCLDEATQRAEKIYKKLKQSYKERYRNYIREMNIYVFELKVWQDKYIKLKEDFEYYSKKCSLDKSWCDERDYYKRLLDDWIRRKPEKPEKPQEPSLKKLIEQQQSLCSKECGCKQMYDICFQNCGGKIIIRRICVENCE